VRLVFSGDLGRNTLPILRDPRTVSEPDVLIMESTYGDRQHYPKRIWKQKMIKIVEETTQRRARSSIPAFAVGRTQQLVYLFQKLIAAKRIPELPISWILP